MQLTASFLLAAGLTVSAAGFSQKVTLSEKNAPLGKVFRDIRQQTGYDFLYTDETLVATIPVTIDLKDADLPDALAACLSGQPLVFTIIEKTVVIRPKPQAPALPLTPPPPIDIHGRVTDSLGNPLAGASVTVKGAKKGVQTDANGFFDFKGVDDHATLVISFTGFISRQLNLDGRNSFAVMLGRSNNPLDEVQVIAYGTTTQRLNAGDVTTVKEKDIEKQPVNNPLLALEGRVPGLFITQANGLPGGGVVVRIQGQNSIQNGNDPLYVIDGVPYTSQLLRNYSAILLGGSGGVVLGQANNAGGNPLSYINPADIESIDILKDADATAIYGSRAANGAILITTKKGKAGQTKVDINMQSGWGQVTRKLNLLNTQQYLQMRHEAFKNDGVTTIPASAYDLTLWDTTRYTDWQKKLIGGTAQYTDVHTTMSGGNATTQYLIGGGYHRETVVFPGDFADQRASLHFNINNVSADQKFRVELSGSYLVDNNQLPGTDLTSSAINLAPDAPPLYNSDGSLNWAPNASGNSTWTNPLSYLYNRYTNKTNNLVSNAALSYQIVPGLDIRSSFGYTNLQSNETQIYPLLSTAPENRPFTSRTAQYGNNNISSWIIEPQARYKVAIGRGRLEALVGTTIEQKNSNMQELIGINYNSDLVLSDIRSAATVMAQNSIASVYKYNAAFGRLNYNWQDKYIIDVTARRDGSSRFGSANEFHDFGAAGAAWVFSQESFIQNSLFFLSFGKLRASYGTTGNDQIGDYNFLNLYSPYNVAIPYEGATGLLPIGLPNPYLQWEETRKLQFGLDLGFLKDRILFNANYFHNRSSNQLIPYVLPITTGFSSIARNFPATVQNSGLELSINTVNIKTKYFSWTSSFNITIPNNKLVSFPNLVNSPFASSLIVGRPITIKKVYHLLGVNDSTGKYQFADSKGNPTYTPSYPADATVIINTASKFYGGFQNSFSYKGFQLDILFQFVKQIALNYHFGLLPGVNSNQPVSVLNRWQNPGDHTDIERYNQNYSLIGQYFNASVSSDGAYSDASYIRLKNLSLSWQLPEEWRKKARLQKCRLYVQGQNLLTITRYDGLDPENLTRTSLPVLRVLTLGVQVVL